MDPGKAMRIAMEEALRGQERGEVPIGAVLLEADRILARAHNETILANDPSAHAEIVAIRRAAMAAGNHRLPGTILCVTLEPCMMCFGAILQARIGVLYFGARDPKAGGLQLFEEAQQRGLVHGKLAITGGILEEPAGAMLTRFFREKRE